jgi:hypothetical protein
LRHRGSWQADGAFSIEEEAIDTAGKIALHLGPLGPKRAGKPRGAICCRSGIPGPLRLIGVPPERRRLGSAKSCCDRDTPGVPQANFDNGGSVLLWRITAKAARPGSWVIGAPP